MSLSTSRTGTELNLTATIGEDFIITATIQDDLLAAVNLTNATLKALVKTNRSDLDVNAVATFVVSVVSAADGTIKLTLSDAITSTLSIGKTYYFDLHIKLPSSHASYPNYDGFPLWGMFQAVQPVTRTAT